MLVSVEVFFEVDLCVVEVAKEQRNCLIVMSVDLLRSLQRSCSSSWGKSSFCILVVYFLCPPLSLSSPSVLYLFIAFVFWVFVSWLAPQAHFHVSSSPLLRLRLCVCLSSSASSTAAE